MFPPCFSQGNFRNDAWGLTGLLAVSLLLAHDRAGGLSLLLLTEPLLWDLKETTPVT